MRKENVTAACFGEITAQITRSRAAAALTSGTMLPPKPCTKPDAKQVLRGNSKRAALDENNPTGLVTEPLQNKRRVVLRDNDSKVAPLALAEGPQTQVNVKTKTSGGQKIGIVEPKEIAVFVKMEEDKSLIQNMGSGISRNVLIDSPLAIVISKKAPQQMITSMKGSDKSYEGSASGKDIINIDLDHKDPKKCSLYAFDIYNNLRVSELIRIPSSTFMETLQRDITQSMRGILVDWLVEITEEYKPTPETLYFAVYLIDPFLSFNCIERQKLQLVGITCMLIASKYEEICVPHVEEFCFITDSTYTRVEVLQMESQVLNCLGFQVSVPTIQSFLRRFVRAAQASYKDPSPKLEFLTNYLAEFSLVEYDFLKILPSLIATSTVFLARWTLDQSAHPWNQTLEYYTCYKASDLKAIVLALQDLQVNTSGFP
ncbi:hypothetical protein GIB67_022497 [Kingdonia uniflora]|uniref:Cyclin A2 n=1 Tax=Kingdonia uniflora TaxID=39325 RepID=A0A7J7L799_9MAGN|nr:hypothetical protein GIB67_022497 [Kingdonia uniflora]